MEYGTVKGLKRDAEGKNIGSYHPNPLMDNSMYEVEFQSGESEAFAANVIAENIYSQVDEEGRRHMVLLDIIDHRALKNRVKIGDPD